MFDLGGNPNKKNARNETVLHCVCAGGITDKSSSQKIRRFECILLCLQWKGTKLANGSVECVDLKAADEVKIFSITVTAPNGPHTHNTVQKFIQHNSQCAMWDRLDFVTFSPTHISG